MHFDLTIFGLQSSSIYYHEVHEFALILLWKLHISHQYYKTRPLSVKLGAIHYFVLISVLGGGGVLKAKHQINLEFIKKVK